MATTKYREGSQGAAEQKSRRNFLIGAGIVYFLIILLILAIPNYLRDAARRAGTAWIGVILILVSYAGILFHDHIEPKKSSLDWLPNALIVVCLVLGILTAIGFNFDLAGLKPR